MYRLTVKVFGPLDLWRGEPFEDASAGMLEQTEAERLVEHPLAALERRIDPDVATGCRGGLVSEAKY